MKSALTLTLASLFWSVTATAGIVETMDEQKFSNLAFYGYEAQLSSEKDAMKLVKAISRMEEIQAGHGNLELPLIPSLLDSLAMKVKGNEDALAVLRRYAFRSFLSGGKTIPEVLKASKVHYRAVQGLQEAKSGAFGTAVGKLTETLSAKSLPSEIAEVKADLRLALARSFYGQGRTREALAEYEKLFKIGRPMQNALIESGWAHTRLGNYGKALGLSYELETGKLSRFFAPEASAIRAIAFLENCRYAESKRTIDQFFANYRPIENWLGVKHEESLYELAIARAENAVQADVVPEPIWSVWSSSALFRSVQDGIRAAFAEETAVREWMASEELKAPEKAWIEKGLKRLVASRSSGAEKIENHLAGLNATMREGIATESERIRFVRVEVNQGAGRDLVLTRTKEEAPETEVKDPGADAKKKVLRWGKAQVQNPEAETWVDEIGGYEGKSLNRCRQTVTAGK